MRPRILLALACLATAACGGSGDAGGSGSSGGGPSLAIELSVSGTYEGGAVHVVRVERPDGEQVVERTLPSSKRASFDVEPGRYRLLSYQRPCPDAGCDKPGEPVDICGRYFTIAKDTDATARIEVTPDEGCAIEFG